MDLIKDLFKGDKVIWIIFLFLCLISIVEVFSAASTLTYKSGDHWGPITQHSVILMVGVCIVVLVHNIPYKYFRVFPVFLLPLSTLLLIFVMGMGLITGDRVNGAARWMTFFGIQFQPSELAKMAVIIVTAFILSKFQEEDNANPKAFKYIIFGGGNGFFVLKEAFYTVLPGFYTVHHGDFVQFVCGHNHHYAYKKSHHNSGYSH
jgi:cell division protein FtsW